MNSDNQMYGWVTKISQISELSNQKFFGAERFTVLESVSTKTKIDDYAYGNSHYFLA
ncbi:MAG: hypothetical protein WA364_14725 [Candidatus Nitrosopolaris sp.]